MKTIAAYLQLLPHLITAIHSLEEAIPLPSSGKQKLDLLLGIIKTVYDTEESVRREVPWERIATLVASAASAIINALNSLGLFKHQPAR